MKNSMIASALALGLAFGLNAAPADAQGRGKQKDRDRVEEQRRGGWEDDWYDRDRIGDRSRDGWGRTTGGNGAGKVPPGWCRGTGNPHNTVENCGYGAATSRGPTGSVGGGGSYEQSHANFHRELDYRYERLAAQRPLDLQYQLELRARKRAEHDEWHRRAGIRH
jgi:hypothetical protein